MNRISHPKSAPAHSPASTLGHIQQLSVIAPVHNNEGKITVRVEELLDILTDAQVPFEFLLLDFASTDSTTEMIGELGRRFPQVKSVFFPELDINGAISAAIKAADGDLIVILEEGPQAVQQLTQLLKESLQFQFHAAKAASEAFAAAVQGRQDATEIDPDHYDLSGRDFGRDATHADFPGIESRVLKRLESWAMALKREAESRTAPPDAQRASKQPVPTGPGRVPESPPTNPAGSEGIERLDRYPQSPKRKLPKFITRFHEFI